VTLEEMDAAPGFVSQVPARVQFHVTRGRPAAVPHSTQPALRSSPRRAAGSDLIP